MSFDDRRGRGRGRQRGHGGPDDFSGFSDKGDFGDRGHGRGDYGHGGGYGQGGGGGGFRQDGGGGRFNDMPDQVVGEGRGTVKFFNSQKGFGFIQCDERPDDVFVHISAVERAGLSGLAEGQEVSFTLVDRRGRVSASNLKIEGDLIEPRAPQGNKGPGRFSRELTGERTSGTVKFFNSQKGYGFITRDDQDNDVFVHISALQEAGLPEPAEGDRLEFDVAVDGRGKSAAVNISSAS